MHTRNVSTVFAGSLVVVGLLLPAVARADFGSHVLPGVTGAALSGHTDIFASGLNSLSQLRNLNVTIDYAVWGPGAYSHGFDDILTSLPISIPSTDYVYAYQIFNNGVNHPNPSNGAPSDTVFSILGIDVLGQIDALGQDLNFDTSGFDVGGTFGVTQVGGAQYYFFTPPLDADDFSAVLLLASPNAPVSSAASIKDSGLSGGGFLPTPVPVPGAALLGMLGLGLVSWARRPS